MSRDCRRQTDSENVDQVRRLIYTLPKHDFAHPSCDSLLELNWERPTINTTNSLQMGISTIYILWIKLWQTKNNLEFSKLWLSSMDRMATKNFVWQFYFYLETEMSNFLVVRSQTHNSFLNIVHDSPSD